MIKNCTANQRESDKNEYLLEEEYENDDEGKKEPGDHVLSGRTRLSVKLGRFLKLLFHVKYSL